MNSHRVLCLLVCASLSLILGRADSFANRLSSDHLLFLESRDLPGYREKLASSPLGKALDELDWKNFIIHLTELGRANLETPNQNAGEPGPSAEEMKRFLTRIEDNWRDISSHLSGDMAFAMGNFKSVSETFQKNKLLRAKFHELDHASDLAEGETENQVRLAQEAKLDSAELNSILSQFSLWFQVKNSAELATKLETLFSNLLREQTVSRLELQQVDWQDITLYALTPALSENRHGLYWALHQDTGIITLNEHTLRKHLRHLDQPPENPLSAEPDFQEAIAFVGEADAFFFLNPAPIDSLVRTSLPENASPPPMGLPQAEAILTWLALDAVIPFSTGILLEADGFSQRSRMGFKRETALSRILIDPNSAPAPIPAFLHRDFYQLATTHWHIGDGWTRLEQELMTLAPQAAAGLGLVRMLATSQLGFDLKLQFFDHLDSGLVFVQSLDLEVIQALINAGNDQDASAIVKMSMQHPTGGQNFLIGLQLHDKTAIEEAMQRLMTRTHPLGIPEPELVAGTPIHYPVPESFQGGTFNKAASFAITDEYLLISIGTPDLLKKALLARAHENLQLRSLPSFMSLRDRLPPDAESLEYSTSQLQEEGLRMMRFSMSMLQTDLEDLGVPDLQKLARIMDQTLGVTVRKGLVFETESLIKFAD